MTLMKPSLLPRCDIQAPWTTGIARRAARLTGDPPAVCWGGLAAVPTPAQLLLRPTGHPSAQNANDTEADAWAGPTEGVESVKKEDVQEPGGDPDGGSV